MHKTHIILKIKWAKATTRAAIFPVAKEAKIAVTVVPTLAPMTKGYIVSRVKIPAAISGIIRAIVIDEL